jgi:predicted O-methyltransferase YrrM
MDEAIQAVLSEYESRAAREFQLMQQMPDEEWQRRRDEFLISVGHHTGLLLNILAKGAGARNILEVGAAYGYSSIWLAEAARKTSGKVFSLEISLPKQEYARSMIAKAGLAKHVEFLLGDARETIASLAGPFDFVLVDLWKDLYIACFDLFYPKLKLGAIVVADNMLRPEEHLSEALQYRKHARSQPNMHSVLLPVGSGIEVSRYGDAAPNS